MCSSDFFAVDIQHPNIVQVPKLVPISTITHKRGCEISTLWLICVAMSRWMSCIMSATNKLFCFQPATSETTLLNTSVARCYASIQFDDISTVEMS